MAPLTMIELYNSLWKQYKPIETEPGSAPLFAALQTDWLDHYGLWIGVANTVPQIMSSSSAILIGICGDLINIA